MTVAHHTFILAVSAVQLAIAFADPGDGMAPLSIPTPNLGFLHMPDPREGAKTEAKVAILGFYGSHGNRIGNSKVDMACNATFCGNWWTPAILEHFAPPAHASTPHTLQCSEAAYWACQWWDRAQEFEGKNGQQVFEHALELIRQGVPQDPTWGGYGSKWNMMIDILRKKFKPGSAMADALLSTEDAYLLEHQEGYDSDNEWSDFCDGSGSNWLGLNLMRVRDELAAPSALHNWTAYINSCYDPGTGDVRSGAAHWLKVVKSAADALNVALPYTCPPRADLQV